MPRPSPYTILQQDLSLSGTNLLQVAEAVLSRGAPLRFQASGFSMHPSVRNGDVVTVIPPSADSRYRPGDIVLFRNSRNARPAVHRIIGNRNGRFLMAGDNISMPDGYVAESDILGLVTRIERRGRKVRFGLGPERFLVLLLVRIGIFRALVKQTSVLYRTLFSREKRA